MYRVILIIISTYLFGCVSMFKAEDSEAADSYIRLAMALMSQGYIKDAKEALLVAQKIAPKSPQVWCSNAVFYERVGEVLAAHKSYQCAIHLAPKNGRVNFCYGNFLLRIQAYELAKTYFLWALNDDTFLDREIAYKNIGYCALGLKQDFLAKFYFNKARRYNFFIETSGLAKIF